jgi:hypothetical protein
MSKIFTKTNREPLLVLIEVAKKIQEDFKNDSIPKETLMSIKHLEGVKTLLKSDIRGIDLVYKDHDYYTKKSEIDPRPQNMPVQKEFTPEEEEASNKAMLRVRENLKKSGIIKN